MTTPTQQWSDWLPHEGGPCPIPWAKAGELVVQFDDGDVVDDATMSALDWGYHWGDGCKLGHRIVAYRHKIRPTEAPAEPSPSLVEAAEAMAAALEPFAATAEHDIGESETDADRFAPMLRHNRAPHITVGDVRRARIALALYRTTSKEG